MQYFSTLVALALMKAFRGGCQTKLKPILNLVLTSNNVFGLTLNIVLNKLYFPAPFIKYVAVIL